MLSESVLTKYEELQRGLSARGRVAIGYSGGVDSTLPAKAAVDILGNRTLAETMGVRFLVVETEETDVLKIRENPPDRCYCCKTELFGNLGEIAGREGLPLIADGTIADDLGDFRPGIRAKSERRVRSPLLETGFTKADVRELSRHLGLPTWDKPSFACLSSRFPYEMQITRKALSRVDHAETLLRDLGFRVFRIRVHDENTARIEAHPDDLLRLLGEEIRTKVLARLKDLGFIHITLDLQGYRSGSMNEVLPAKLRRRYAS